MLLFGGAGRLDWGWGWLFFSVWGLLKPVFIFLLRWHAPELLVERATRHKNAQRYERWILPAYFLLSFGTLLAAGLDGGRFRWSREVPLVVVGVAYCIYLAAILLWPVTGLLLGSWWAVIPGLLAALTMCIRTNHEDRILQAELPGYVEYTHDVRARLFPGIW